MQSVNAGAASHGELKRTWWRILLLCLLAAVAAAFLFLETAWAQDGAEDSYVDLVMLYAYDSNEVAYRVQNNGTATATGVTVSFLLEDLETSLDTPSITDKMTEDGTNQSFTWEVGTLPPGGASRNLTFSTRRHSGVTTTGEVGVINATASSFSPEPDTLLANNVRKVYTYFASSSGSTLHMRGNTLALLLSVDDLQPAPGGDVDLDLTARNAQGGAGSESINLIADAEVKVELSQGLQFKDGWTPPAAFVKSGSQSATWSPPDTDTRSLTTTIPATQKIEDIEIQLTSDTLEDIPLKERCITARVTDSIPPPTPGYVLGSLTRCLGDDPLVLFEENQLDLFTLEVTAQNDLELVARANLIQQMQIRSRGIGRGSDNFMPVVILSPERTIIQVKDSPSTRGSVTDNSVTSMTWQTKGGDVDRGVEVRENIDDILPPSQQNNASTVWTSGKDKLTATGIDGGSKPGTLRIFIADESFKLADADNTGFTSNADAYDFGGGNGMVTGVVVLHFGELGTYKVGKAYKGTHNTAGEKTTSDETYIFHVGPIAELEVRDAGGNPEVLDSQRAYTIIAMNNGPDDPPSAQVTVTGLNAGDYVSHNATVGSFDSGTGIWTIGELKNRESYQAKYGRDGEVLTIITSAAVDTEITAAISNTQDYQVCIDSSGDDVIAADESACTGTAGNTWHTAKYYDYISDKDSATIQAKDGTGADLPSLQSPQAKTAAIVVSWNEVPDVNGRQVTHYEVNRGTNPWEDAIHEVQGTTYVDTDVEAGDTFQYRVRAVNDQDQKGPWSQPMEGTAAMMEPQTITEYRDRVVTRTETVTVAEDAYAYFAEEEVTRTVAENSAPGSPVGAPVTVLRNSGNKVAYSLEGPDAALFTIEEDSGQILVGEGAILDYESGATSYTVVVVADPSSGDSVRATVTISVVDVSETVFVFVDPSGAPQEGVPLFASLLHTEGDPVEPRWQWQRSMPDGTWADIPGAIQDVYIPTELDAGRRLRALVVFGNPRGDGEGLAGAVTERLPGEARVIPTAGTGAAPEEVFGVLGHNLAAVWLYDNATQTWAVYSPWNPPEVNDLKTVSSGDVVWMDVISEVQFQGKTLYPGWNLIVVN